MNRRWSVWKRWSRAEGPGRAFGGSRPRLEWKALWTPVAVLSAALCTLAPGWALASDENCRPLFDGETLTGWTVLGEAPFTVEHGAIVGTPVETQENSFLRTDETFADFDLKLAFRFQAGMFNSGVQFRSDTYAEETPIRVRARDGEWHDWTARAGRVFGYQADIDPSERGWTGEIYDESSRGWLDTFDKTPVKHMIESDRWHTLRIRAVGPHIRTWLDDQPIADFQDDFRSDGFIALQVHGVYEAIQVGKTIAFRDIEICSP